MQTRDWKIWLSTMTFQVKFVCLILPDTDGDTRKLAILEDIILSLGVPAWPNHPNNILKYRDRVPDLMLIQALIQGDQYKRRLIGQLAVLRPLSLTNPLSQMRLKRTHSLSSAGYLLKRHFLFLKWDKYVLELSTRNLSHNGHLTVTGICSCPWAL